MHDLAFANGTSPRRHHLVVWVATPRNIGDLPGLLQTSGSLASIERRPGRHGISNAFFLHIRDKDSHRTGIYCCDYGQDAPPGMPMFPRFARSFMRHGVALIRPPQSPQLDDEGDIAMIIGKRGGAFPRRTPVRPSRRLGCATTARSAIWVRHAKVNVMQGKNGDGSGAKAPWLMPLTDAAQIVDVTREARVNGDLRQSDRTGPMLFPVTRQIAHCSPFTTSVSGDIIATGTPVAAGARFDPAVWLQPGNVAEMSSPGIGALRNGVVNG